MHVPICLLLVNVCNVPNTLCVAHPRFRPSIRASNPTQLPRTYIRFADGLAARARALSSCADHGSRRPVRFRMQARGSHVWLHRGLRCLHQRGSSHYARSHTGSAVPSTTNLCNPDRKRTQLSLSSVEVRPQFMLACRPILAAMETGLTSKGCAVTSSPVLLHSAAGCLPQPWHRDYDPKDALGFCKSHDSKLSMACVAAIDTGT